jgi:hypothetical protein
MRTLTRLATAASVLLLASAIAACSGASPTASATVPAGPHFDSGVTFGSGNFAPDNADSGNSTVAADSGSTAARGGVGFGSGN